MCDVRSEGQSVFICRLHDNFHFHGNRMRLWGVRRFRKAGRRGGKDVWSVLTEEGRWNELVTLASAEFQKDTAGGYYAEAVYPAAHLAQSYLFMDKYDSSAYYLGYMEKYLSGTADRDGIPSAEMYKSGLIYYNRDCRKKNKTS